MRKMIAVVFAAAAVFALMSDRSWAQEGGKEFDNITPQVEPSTPAERVVHLDGLFLCQGTMPDGTEYTIQVAMKTHGDSFDMLWYWPNNNRVVATGLGFYSRVGNELILSAYYLAEGDTPGVMVYAYDAEKGEFVGQGTTKTLEGTVYPESLRWMSSLDGTSKAEEPQATVPETEEIPIPNRSFVMKRHSVV